jgi:hypothetical protein
LGGCVADAATASSSSLDGLNTASMQAADVTGSRFGFTMAAFGEGYGNGGCSVLGNSVGYSMLGVNSTLGMGLGGHTNGGGGASSSGGLRSAFGGIGESTTDGMLRFVGEETSDGMVALAAGMVDGGARSMDSMDVDLDHVMPPSPNRGRHGSGMGMGGGGCGIFSGIREQQARAVEGRLQQQAAQQKQQKQKKQKQQQQQQQKQQKEKQQDEQQQRQQ